MAGKLPNTLTRPFPRYERQGECARCGACCANEECEHYIPPDPGAGTPASCSIHGAEARPDMCLTYPDNPPLVFKTCGYHFVDLWEDRQIVRGKL